MPYLCRDALLGELAKRGFIIRYEVDGAHYIAIVNWRKHQQPHVKESESAIPPPPPVRPHIRTEPAPDQRILSNKYQDKAKDLSQDQEQSLDQETKIADQVPALTEKKTITPRTRAPVATRLPDDWPLTP